MITQHENLICTNQKDMNFIELVFQFSATKIENKKLLISGRPSSFRIYQKRFYPFSSLWDLCFPVFTFFAAKNVKLYEIACTRLRAWQAGRHALHFRFRPRHALRCHAFPGKLSLRWLHFLFKIDEICFVLRKTVKNFRLRRAYKSRQAFYLTKIDFCLVCHALRFKIELRHALQRHALPERAEETML